MPLDASSYPRTFKSSVSPVDADLIRVSLDRPSPASAPVFILTFLSAQTPDNRLTPQFLTALLSALVHVEATWESSIREMSPNPGAALVLSGTTTGPHSKFFSNGLDFESAIADPHFFDRYLFPVYERLLVFPLPVVASIGGHCFAAAFGLASACDFAVMGKKGFLCMNEIDFGAQIPPGLWSPLSTRIVAPSHRRRVVLQGERFPGAEALQCGFVDEYWEQAGPEEVLARSVELARKWSGKSRAGVWGENKRIIHVEQLQTLRTPYEVTLSKL